MDYKISDSEYRFMQELWKAEPVKSSELVVICREQLGWKKSTTYTVIKNLTNKGVVVNDNTIVSSMVAKEEVVKQESEEFLNRAFDGDIPEMFAAFLKDRKLSSEEFERIKKIIEEA